MPDNLIEIRDVTFQGRTFVVIFTRNESGTVSGQCMLAPTECPIIDGPSVSTVLRTIEETLETLLFVRAHKHA